jgi:NitT/TauT family transport system substrate-binding protein
MSGPADEFHIDSLAGKGAEDNLVTAAGVGIWLAARGTAGRGGPLEKVILGVYPGEISAPVYVAQEKGFFAAHGLEVSMCEYETGASAVQALVDGEVEMATAADFVLVNNSFRHGDLRALASMAMPRTHHLIARRDRGVEEVSDLKGKKVGITMNTNSEFLAGRFLVINGLRVQDVAWEDIKPSDLGQALLSGQVDAVATWDPHAYGIERELGEGAVSWPTQGGQDFFWLLVSRESFLHDRPGAAEGILASLVEAEGFMRSHPGEAQGIAAAPMGLDQAYMDYVWPNIDFSLDLQQGLLLTMESEARWVMDKKLGGEAAMPNYLGFIYLEGLEKVKPEAVTIFR